MSKIKLFLSLFVAAVLLVVGWFAMSFAEPFAAAQSVVSPAEGLYTFTCRGNYGFDEFLAEGGASSADEMAQYISRFLTRGLVSSAPRQSDFGCSVMSVWQVTAAIERVVASSLRWTAIFDSHMLEVTYYQRGDFLRPYKVTLNEAE